MAYNAEYHRAYRLANKERLAELGRRYQRANRDRLKAYLREYYLKNKAKLVARATAWGKANPEKKYAAIRAWEKRNPAKVAARQARWVSKNLPKCAIKSKKRREMLRSVEQTDSISSKVLAQLISSCARMKCAICGKNMPKNDRTYDHVIPLSKGGTGHIANLQIVHLSCNCAKRCKTPAELTGQHEMNFAGNGAQPNTTKRENSVTLDSTV